ncbi:PREDICTED: uncharacterized protein LOC109481527 [Branchiostoma belcheri]|uniref:Uncharacterized protein LOC109481527 n=1 Tax=Branchiostoma belcheri TaxID=7741 RepID=A0A6P5A8L8_BRABE|nr:PREDICTED: uncharacterized protein LOC109481527 [Branchiostoma belcheri]
MQVDGCRVTCRAAAVGVLGLLWVVTAVFTCPEKCTCNSVGSVDCNGRGLKDVPANIPLNTTKLVLRSNSIQNLSDADFSNLTSLEELYLDYNDIRVLPARVFLHLTRLKKLYLSDNHITDLPDGVFSHLTSLKRLYLRNNNISRLPAVVFSHLTRLERLYLPDNHIADLPDGVFSNLNILEWLYLRNNNITSLPAGVFSHLTMLDRLDLGNNDIRVLPAGVFSRLPRLTVLSLSDNHIADLRDGVFSNLTSLERLNLRNNNITSLPAGVFSHLTMLDSLDLGNNDIRVLPAGVVLHLTMLDSLDLDGNDIRVLPAGVFSHLTRLKALSLSDNHIADLPDGVFSNLTSLEVLYLHNNNISRLPAGVFSHLTRLWRLYLSDNHIADLPDGVFSHLTRLMELDLSDNHITDLPDGVFSHLPRLKVLYLSDNHIADLPDGVFSNLTRLYKLHLSNNNISSLPADIKHLSTLKTLAITGNPWRCDCSLQDIMTSQRVRHSISDNPTCSSPLHMKGDSLHGAQKICSHRGVCTTGGTDGICACDVGWTGPYCGEGLFTSITVRVGRNENFNQNDQCGITFTANDIPDSTVMFCDPPIYSRYVSVHIMGLLPTLELCEVELCEVEVSVKDICCNDSIELVNGQITPTGGGYCSGNEIQFSCDPGYEVIGNSSATCQKDGSWDRGIPTCQRICCDNTTRIKNGQIRVNEDYCSGSSIEFTCDTGYELDGKNYAVCQRDKNWDREIPTCQRVCCDNITEIMHGEVIINATDGHCYGKDIRFSCNPGYELVGSYSVTCQEDGNWGPEIPTCQLPTKESRTSTEAIIGGTTAGIAAVLIVAAVVFMVFLRRRRKRREEEYISQSVAYFVPDDIAIHRRRMEEANPLVPPRPQFPRLETDPSRVTLGEKIGSGAFGIVYRAILAQNDRTEDVVVKTVKETAGEEEKLGFLEEIRAVVDLGVHKNLLGLVGCCTVTRDHLYLITEFMPYGDLKSFLRKCREEETLDESRDDIYTFEVIQMYQVAWQIARGMDHIARSRYVHGDLAARNVLVGKRLHVKISDFGLAEDIYSRGYRRQNRLQRVPWKWMAPERLEGGQSYTSQSDVWSFGIVLYEICTLGGDPYPGVSVSELKDRLQAGFRMNQPEDCPRAMYDVMQQCWRWQPIQRPLFSQLYLTLDKHLAVYGPEYLDTN